MIGSGQTGSDTLIKKLTAKEIADDLEPRIRAGDYPADKRIPYGELAKLYGVSRSTIQRAMGLLQDRGFVEYHPGRGMFTRSG